MEFEKDIHSIDLVNIMLGAIIGAVVGNSEAFHPTNLAQVLHCLLIIFLILGFTANCHMTIVAFENRRPGFAVASFVLFLAIEAVLISEIVVVHNTNNSVNLQFELKATSNIWVLCIMMGALYALNVVTAIRRDSLEGK